MAAFGARGIAILTSLITVPLTLHYLGLERYGMWMTMSSMIAMFSFADLGIGNGLLNAISGAHGRGDRESAATYVSSAFAALTLICLTIGLVFALAYPYVPWPRVFNVQSARAVSEAGPAVAVFVLSFLFSLPLGVVQRIRMGYQEGFIDSAWATAGSIGAFVAVITAVQLEASLPVLVAAMAGMPALVQLVNASVLFGKDYPWLRPRISAVHRAAAIRVMSAGGYFFVLQVAAAVAFQSDSLILAQMMGPEYVSRYAVPMKLFSLAPMVLGFIYVALWPAYGESIARGDSDWAKTSLMRSIRLTLAVSIPVSAFLVLSGQSIIRLWVGPAMSPTLLVLLAMGAWAVIGSVSAAIASFMNGAGILRFQTICAVFMMVANVGISIVLTRMIGLSGVVWGSVIAQVVFVLIPLAFYIRWLFKQDDIAVATVEG